MEQLLTAKKWGNSFGIIIPSELAKQECINEGTELIVNIKAKHKTRGKDLIALGKRLGLDKKLKGIDTLKALKDVDKELWPED